MSATSTTHFCFSCQEKQQINMDNYENVVVHKYMDGRYFPLVLEELDYEGLQTEPLILERSNGGAKITNIVDEYVNGNGDVPTVSRVIITHVDNDTELDRHSNLLIVDHKAKKVMRFEPLDVDEPDVNDAIADAFPDHKILVDEIHPQSHLDKNFWCNAYVTEYARQWINGNNEPDFTDFDPDHYTQVASAVYGTFEPDVEFAEFGPFGYGYGGALTGGLIGAGLGGLAFGGPGALIGGLAGASLGGYGGYGGYYGRPWRYGGHHHHHHGGRRRRRRHWH
jgi:hypothetical protein